MANIEIKDLNNNVVESLELSDDLVNKKVNKHAIYRAVVSYTTNQRQGTSSTKNKAEVRGGGIKPWRQKGTGRARMGSLRTPLRRGGGIIFGPTPRDYSYKLSKKERNEALKSSLSVKLKQGEIVVVDSIALEHPKTKLLKLSLEKLGINGSALILISNENKNLELAARNIKGVDVCNIANLNTYTTIKHEKLLCTKDSMESLCKRFSN